MKINNPKVLVFQKAIQIPGMFLPSNKDQMTVNWLNGVPSPHYSQKMKEDKNYIFEDDLSDE